GLAGGTLEIFLEAMLPPVLLHVFGAGPVARALAAVGAAVGYDVRAVTDPAAPIAADTDAVVVASHGRDEAPVLTAALSAGVGYVGVGASRRRGAAVRAGLAVPAEQRARVHTPAGLDIGARTPPEVALSVLAELVATRAARPGPVARATRTGSADRAGCLNRAGRAAWTESSEGEERSEHSDQTEKGQRSEHTEAYERAARFASTGIAERSEPGLPEHESGERGLAEGAGAVAPVDVAGAVVAGVLTEAVDPVCGMAVAVAAGSLAAEHAGRTWYFCGPGCRQAFLDDPGRYAG